MFGTGCALGGQALYYALPAMPRQLLSIVVPVFNEAEVIGETYRRLTRVAAGLDGMDY